MGVRRRLEIAVTLALIGAGAAVVAWGTAAAPGPPTHRFAGLELGHRGVRVGAPENTLEAIRAAHAGGADGVELDVVQTRDRVLVIAHDPVDAVGDHPTLDEALSLAQELELVVELELKTPLVDPRRAMEDLSTALAAHDAFEHVFVSSFSPVLLRKVRTAEPRVATAHPVPVITGWGALDRLWGHPWVCRWLGAGIVEPSDGVASDRSISRWQAAGLAVNVWTVNETAERERLQGLGATVTTDCPGASCPAP